VPSGSVRGDQDDARESLSVGTSRRSILKKAAVGAGVVWVAPIVLSSTPAFAVGSTCGTVRTFSWPNNPPGGDGSSANFSNWNAGASNGGANAVSITGSFVGGGGISRYDTSVNTIGGTATNFQISKDNAAVNATAVLTLVFSTAVLGLDFTLLDVDKSTTSNSHYSDEVTVTALTSGNTPVFPTTTQLGVPAGGGGAATPLDVTGTYPTFRGIGSANDATTNSNVRLIFPTTNGAGVKTLTITYKSAQAYVCSGADCVANPTNPSTTQWAAISAIKWC
jgi:hypothetical protein